MIMEMKAGLALAAERKEGLAADWLSMGLWRMIPRGPHEKKFFINSILINIIY